MIIAIDYDETYTADPRLWSDFIATAQYLDHEVICVTFRHTNEGLPADIFDEIYPTGGRPKAEFLQDRKIFPDIWIDDSPWSIYSISPLRWE